MDTSFRSGDERQVGSQLIGIVVNQKITTNDGSCTDSRLHSYDRLIVSRTSSSTAMNWALMVEFWHPGTNYAFEASSRFNDKEPPAALDPMVLVINPGATNGSDTASRLARWPPKSYRINLDAGARMQGRGASVVGWPCRSKAQSGWDFPLFKRKAGEIARPIGDLKIADIRKYFLRWCRNQQSIGLQLLAPFAL